MRFDQPVLLYGAGREARSTLAFLKEITPETEIFVTADSGPVELEGTSFIAVDTLPDAIMAHQFGLIVKSPGVSLYKPIFDAARHAHIPVTSNLNLWGAHFRKGRQVIAITGTKGKSTTATLTWLMLTHSGVDAGLAGNVGVAPLDIRDHHKTVVFELSSYQTADMDFAVDFAGFTNLYPEHVDWHGSVEQYYKDKLNLIDRKGRFRVAMSTQAHGTKEARAAIHHNTRRIMILDSLYDDAVIAAAKNSKLKGAHNLDNARLAARLALAAGASLDGVLAGIAAFAPLPHRLEEHTIGGKLFVDDSISTTPEATKAALQSYAGKKIALIAGGHERQQNYQDLAERLPGSDVTLLFCLPDTGARLAEAVGQSAPHIKVVEAPDLQTAMQTLSTQAALFDTVILSPGAPSYNQFRNFEERGEAFISLAKQLFGT